MDKLNNYEDAKRLLQGLGLHIDETVVRQVVNVLSGKAHQSLYSLYTTRPDKPVPVCGKGSVYKIKKLYGEGELQPYLDYVSDTLTIGEAKAEQIKEAEHDVPKESLTEQEPYGETPHKQEESLIVHGLSPGTSDVEFLVTNMSNNLLLVDRICVEIMHWEQYDARLTTGARIMDFKYEVKIKPNFIGEIPVLTPKFKYAKGDIDSFSISFISPPGNKYITRINFYCSDPATGKRFTVSTDKFEIRFRKHRIVSGEGTPPIHDAIAQAQKLINEAKRKK
jgi:hypothetical protein